MADTPQAKAAHLHMLAIQFRGFAAATEWLGYRARMLEMAQELDFQAARQERDQPWRRAATSRAG